MTSHVTSANHKQISNNSEFAYICMRTLTRSAFVFNTKMSNCDSDSGSDVEFNIFPYQFEPMINVDEQSVENYNEENVNSPRLGNTDW